MKRCIVPFLFIIFSFSAAAEGPSMAFGFSLEMNMNARSGYALGSLLQFDGAIGKQFAAGVSLGLSRDFLRFVTIEPEAFFRWYIPFLRSSDGGHSSGGFFIQGDAGMSMVHEEADMRFSFMGGGTAGFRYASPSGSYYIEPYVRGGYPFLWGAGIAVGCRF